MNKTIKVELENFNLVIGKQWDYKVHLITENLKSDPEVDVLEIFPYDNNIIKKIDEVIDEINEKLEYYSKNRRKKESKIKWLIIDDYILATRNSDKDKLNSKIMKVIYKGRLADTKVLIGTRLSINVGPEMRCNMKIINSDEI